MVSLRKSGKRIDPRLCESEPAQCMMSLRKGGKGVDPQLRESEPAGCADAQGIVIFPQSVCSVDHKSGRDAVSVGSGNAAVRIGLCLQVGHDGFVFFRVFQCGSERLISRAWFEEDLEETAPAEVSSKGPWNGEYYVSFGEEDGRRWEDARKYGFISAGGGPWYTKTLSLLSPGDRVWVNIPHTGYVGVGIVTEAVQQAKDVVFNNENVQTPMKDLPLLGKYLYSEDDPENAEYVVKVQWLKTVATSKAVKEIGFFGNQNSVCRPTAERWAFTVDRLKKCWGIVD